MRFHGTSANGEVRTMRPCLQALGRFGALLALLLVPHTAYGQAQPTFDIGILIDLPLEDRSLLDQLETEIRAVVGEDATVNFPAGRLLSNEFDPSLAEAHYQTLLADGTDIIIAFGPVNAKVLSRREEYPKPTILFGAANLELMGLSEERRTSGIDNFNYLIASHSYRRDLETLKALFDFEHVAVLVEQPLAEILSVQDAVAGVVRDLRTRFTLVPYESLDSLRPHLDEVDAVYLAEGFSLTPVQIEELARTLRELEIPSFTSTSRRDVELGLMATNQTDESVDLFFRRIALNVEAVVNGTNPSELPTYVDLAERLTINWNTARKVRVPINFSLIATTDFVGDFRNVLAERTYSLLGVIDEALKRNLGFDASRTRVDLAKQDVRAAKSAYLPDLSAAVTTTYVDPETARLAGGANPEVAAGGNMTVTQNVFSEQANAGIDIRRYQEDAERENLSAAELDLILDAANAYFNNLILKTNVRIRGENLELTRENLRVAERNFEAGQAGRSDVLRFRSELAQNMQLLIEAIHQFQEGLFVLNELLNHPVRREIDVADAAIDDEIFKRYQYEEFRDFLEDPSRRRAFASFLVVEAKRNAPELRSLDYSLEAIRRNIALNGWRFYLPTIAAQARFDRTFDQWGAGKPPEATLRNNFTAAIGLTIPLFAQNRRDIDRQTSLLERRQVSLNRASSSLAIERNVEAAVLDVVNQMANIELSKVAEEAARGSLELRQAAYANGAATLVELLDAQNNYLQAQSASATAGYNYLLTSMVLQRFIGYYFLLRSESDNQAFTRRFLEYLETAQR